MFLEYGFLFNLSIFNLKLVHRILVFDCSHFIKRSRFQTRFLEINSIAAHRWCHIEHELDPKKHKEFWINLLGEDVVDELTQLSNGDLPNYKSLYGGSEHIKALRSRLMELS